jgi:DNA-directed RNA polymerase specialized sigma24 family protein
MRENVASLTKSLRRYAHALLGRWPVADARVGDRSRADRDADDLAHEALIGFWRAGLLEPIANRPDGAIKLALLRCVTALARKALPYGQDLEQDLDEFPLFPPGETSADPFRRAPRHVPWSPEARALPRLPFESRALLALAALERLDYEDIGAVLDMSTGQALTKLARARTLLASEMTGINQPFLRTACGVCEAELHAYADDLLEPSRRAEIAALLEVDCEAAGRAELWRRGAERLRGAFATLEAEPLPATLNFDPPVKAAGRGRSARKSWKNKAWKNKAWKSLVGWLVGAPRPAVTAH